MKSLFVSLALFASICFGQIQFSAFVGGTGYGAPAPGGAATIYGTFPGIAALAATTATLPKTLGGVTVAINGVTAPVYYVSSTQINLQVPWSTVPGPSTLVTVNGSSHLFPTLASSPNMFVMNVATSQAAVLNLSYQLIDITQSVFAHPADVIQIYCTGLGLVSNTPADGSGGKASPLSYALNAPQVQINGEKATVLFAGLAPGYAGLYQINAVVPLGVSLTGPYVGYNVVSHEMAIQLINSDGTTSNLALVGFQP